MVLIALGALLVVIGIAVAAMQTASRGKMSDPHAKIPGHQMDTLEPRGKGRQLSLKADLPGFLLVAVGAALIFMGAST